MGKKTPFYRWGKIQPLCSQPAQSGTTARPHSTTARDRGTTACEWYKKNTSVPTSAGLGTSLLVRSSTTALGAAVVPLWSGSKKLHPLQFAVVPLQPFQNTKTATTFADGLRIR